MQYDVKPLGHLEAFGRLLDFSGELRGGGGLDIPSHQFGIRQHFDSVARYLALATHTVVHEQAEKKPASAREETADCR